MEREQPIRIDLSESALSDEEIEKVQGILEEQMPGFVLVRSQERSPFVIWVDPSDLSPPLHVLQAHAANVVEYGESREDAPLVQGPTFGPESDLRMYLARHRNWPDDWPPHSIVVDFALGLVVG